MRLNKLIVMLQLMQLMIFYSTTCFGLENTYPSSNDINVNNGVSKRNECVKKCDIKKERFDAGLREINIGVLFPSNKSLLQGRNTVLQLILPVIQLAVENITKTNYLLPNCKLRVFHKDTSCSSVFGPLAALELHSLNQAGKISLAVKF